MKHPNVATKDLEDRIRNASLIKEMANGKKAYATADDEIMIVGRDGEIITIYKPEEENLVNKGLQARPSGNQGLTETPTDGSPLTSKNLPQQSNEVNLNKAFALPSKQQTASEMERLYGVYSLRTIENTRKALNKAINKAAKEEDNEALAALMKQKEAIDDGLNALAEAGRLEGDASQYDKLLKARELEAEHNRKFNNYTVRNEFGQNKLDLGAKELLDLLGTDLNYTPSDFAKTLGLSNTKKQLGIVKRAREIFGDAADPELQEMFLNNIFTDISNVGRGGNLNMKQAIKSFTEKVEKNNEVAKELFTPLQINQMKEYVELIKKLDTNFDANPSGSSSALAKLGIGSVARKIPYLGDVLTAIQEDIVQPAKIRRYLKQNAIKEQRFKEPNKVTESIAKLLYAPVITQEQQ